MTDLVAFVKRIGAVWAFILAGGLLLPVVSIFLGLAPPGTYYTSASLGVLTGFLVLGAIILLWSFGRGLGKVAAKRWMAFLLALAFAGLLAFFYAEGRFVRTAESGRYIAGCEWSETTHIVAKSLEIADRYECPGNVDFMFDNSAKAKEIWTRASVEWIELALYGLWIVLSLVWVLLTGLFALHFVGGRGPGAPGTPEGEAGADHPPS